MSTTTGDVSKEAIVVALEDVWGSIVGLFDELTEQDLARPTPCTDWSVRDIVAHMIATESTLLGESGPNDGRSGPAADPTDDASTNERWIEALRAIEADAFGNLFRDRSDRRLDELRHMTDQAWAEELAPFGPVPGMPYRHLMVVRVLDCWMHEQDIRDATGRPGHEWGPAAATTVDAIASAIGATPVTAGASPPGTVTIEVTESGRIVRRFGIIASTDEGGEATTITMAAGPWTRWCGGRRDLDTLRNEITIAGSQELAIATLEGLRGEW